MRIDAEILEVSTNGEKLRVVLQGTGPRDGLWRAMTQQVLTVADTTSNRKAMHVGRQVRILVELR